MYAHRSPTPSLCVSSHCAKRFLLTLSGTLNYNTCPQKSVPHENSHPLFVPTLALHICIASIHIIEPTILSFDQLVFERPAMESNACLDLILECQYKQKIRREEIEQFAIPRNKLPSVLL